MIKVPSTSPRTSGTYYQPQLVAHLRRSSIIQPRPTKFGTTWELFAVEGIMICDFGMVCGSVDEWLRELWDAGAGLATAAAAVEDHSVKFVREMLVRSGCSTSESTEVQDPNHQIALPASALQQGGNEEENKLGDGSENVNVNEEEDEDEDVDFNPFLKETNSLEASSSLSSDVDDLDTDVADSGGKRSAAFAINSKENHIDTEKGCRTSENVEHGEEIATFSCGEAHGEEAEITHPTILERDSLMITQSGNGSLCDKENGSTCLTDVSNATNSRKPVVDMDADGAICMRTRARYSLASFTLDELETFLQETDDEDDLQNVDDEEEYRKFLAAVLRGDDSQNLQGNVNADDEDEENDADFELELEEALESEPDEIEERRITRRNRRQKASLERSKKVSGQLNRPLRPLLPFASVGSFPAFDGKHFTPNIAPSCMPPVNNGFNCGFTPHQIGQLHCLIHEHVQLLIQVFSVCVIEPGKNHIAAEVKDLISKMLQKRDEVLRWRTLPYPSFCFFPPYVHPSVPDELHKMLPPNGSTKNVQRDSPSGSNKELHSDIGSLSNGREKHLECTSWVPYICGPVLSVIDVAPLRLVENYMDDVSSAVQAYEEYKIELGFENCCQKEPLFPLHNSQCSADSDGQGETENVPPDSSGVLSSSSSNRIPKKTMAATLLEKAKNQPITLVPNEIAKLTQRFWPLFNTALYPHKPPPVPLANRVLFTDAEDESPVTSSSPPDGQSLSSFSRKLGSIVGSQPDPDCLLALGLMEYNTDWKSIQQRFLPCKSRHQIFVRQKNRASSKAPENPIKAVRRMKNSPLTSEEIACIEAGLKKFKLDWISIWRFFVPYRDPSLLPRQWRIASGTQKSYKSDANKKAKRRLYELGRKNSKPSPSTLLSSSEKEGDSTDNAIEETNSGDNRVDKEDQVYVHEAFLADWRPDNNVSLNCPTRLPSQEGFQARQQIDNSGPTDIQPQMCSKSPAAVRSSTSQVVLRPYRARKTNSARLVKLAPNLPPVNLPPSVRVMSQSAFKNISGNASKNTQNTVINARSSNSVKITPSNQDPKQFEVLNDKRIAEKGDSDLQMHPLLFQAPQDGRLPYYPLNSSTSTSSSFTFFSGKQPQLSLSLFHNPRHIRDAVNFLSKSSKPPEKNDFHPLLQRTDDVDADSIAEHSAPPRQRCNSSASGTRKVNELDLDIHLSFTSKNQETVESRNMTIESESARDSSRKKDSAPDADLEMVISREKGSRKVSENVCDESIPEIIMEQEELSDSEEEFGENVEFECEEMADSEGESTSDSEQFVNMPNEIDELDADIDNDRVLNTCSTSDGQSTGLELAENGVTNIKSNVLSLNLNSCPPVSPHSNPKNAVAGYEFGPFGRNQLLASSIKSSRHVKDTDHVQKRARGTRDRVSLGSNDTFPGKPRKRACRSNTISNNAVSGKGNSSSNKDMSVDMSKNVRTDEIVCEKMKGRWFANDDIPINILSRLSAKSLHYLKYVSKEWHDLISERSFIRSQLKKTEPLSGFFFQEIFQYTDADMESISYVPVEVENVKVWRNVLNFLPENVVILSSNNGLLCCRSCFPTCQPMIYICNPLNKQWRTLQWPNISRHSSVALAFDHFHDPIDVSTDFILVAVTDVQTGAEDEYSFVFDIYSSKTGLWRRSKESCQCNHKITKNKGVFVEGILYWLTDGFQILMFDPKNELSWLIMAPLPGNGFASIPEMCIGESKGKLCYVIISEDGLQQWVLEDNFASQWELRVSISLDELEKENSNFLYKIAEKVSTRLCIDTNAWMDPLAFKDGMLLLRVSTKVYLYQFDIGRMEKLCDVSSLGPKSMFSPIVVPYTMTLVPLGG
ncbi:hypothetical protein BUALT_Bualt07G0004100 [Buddleja alternifolia]|uniref:Uncharacterized protein n=1 Tax=Buddleja alternifolia TaxID=168488 RepID=A0AAV6XF04_9LAMI|nr:hypothetical protein BUALT_Bualt07G0004100 [Buddleja alternifolia]